MKSLNELKRYLIIEAIFVMNVDLINLIELIY